MPNSVIIAQGAGAGKRVGTVAAEFFGNKAVEVIEEHPVAGVGFVLGVTVDEETAAEEGAGVVGFAVTPVEEAAVIVAHDALVGFAGEGLGLLAAKELA